MTEKVLLTLDENKELDINIKKSRWSGSDLHVNGWLNSCM